MPGFWTVLKWAMAVVLAPIIVYVVLALFVILTAAAVLTSNDEPAPKPAAVKKHTPRQEIPRGTR